MDEMDLEIILLYREIFGDLEECDERSSCDCITCGFKERLKIIKELVECDF